jgi:hypothetical protein
MLRTREGAEEALTAVYRDHFDGASGSVWFTRDRNGRVNALHIGESRMWDMVLRRVP